MSWKDLLALGALGLLSVPWIMLAWAAEVRYRWWKNRPPL